MGDAPQFRSARTAAKTDQRLRGLILLAGLFGLVFVSRGLWEPKAPMGTLVEVAGEVPRPGLFSLPEPTVRAAVAAAGGPGDAPVLLLHEGDRVVVSASGYHIEPAGNPALIGVPLDPNTADEEAFAAIPGIGRGKAKALVAARNVAPYRSIDDFAYVPGLNDADIAAITPYVALPAHNDPMDLNTATAAELERLPGIGPVLAARIVVDRADHGPFTSIDELTRVNGVKTTTLEQLRPLVRVVP